MEEIIEKIKSTEDVLEKARLTVSLIKEKGLKVKEVAQYLKVSPSYICHLERIVALPEIIIDGYYANLISASHLFLLSRLRDKDELVEVYEKILSENLTVAQAETLIREKKYQIKDVGDYLKKEEKEKFFTQLTKKFPEISPKLIQTRKNAKLIFQIKGNLEKTSKLIRRIVSELTLEEDS
ncbi:MAG: hypothetical protein NZL96_00090 [Patescibacteria group bacterium]|nr:hypothetical protein [Patescibacteria group bacterium]